MLRTVLFRQVRQVKPSYNVRTFTTSPVTSSVIGDALNKVNMKLGKIALDGLGEAAEVNENVKETVKDTAQSAADTVKKGKEVAEDALQTANLKVGKAALDGLGKAAEFNENVKETVKGTTESAAETVKKGKEAAEDALQAANLKAGKAALDGLGKAAEFNESLKETVEDVKQDAADKVEKGKANVHDANKKLGDAAKHGYEETIEFKESVKENVKDKNREFVESVKDKVDGETQAELKEEVRENYEGYDSLQDKGKKVEAEQSRPPDGI